MFGESDLSNRRWTIGHFSNCYNIIWVSFTLTQGKLSLRGFILKPTETAYVLLKDSTRHFWQWHFFYVTITGNFETNFETNFLKSENLFYKIGSDILL